jgi:cobalt/nickel transport system permease protein
VSGTHHFLTEKSFGDSPIHRLDPRGKILGFLGISVVAVSTPATVAWAFPLYGLVLFFLLGLSRLPAGFVLRRSLVIVPFVLLVAIFLPFFQQAGGGSYNLGGLKVSESGLLVLWNVTAKSLVGVFSLIILVSTTSFPELMSGLERLHVPRIFTLVASFMYRYTFLFVEEFQRMRRAMTARNYRGRWFTDAPVLGHLLSSLFLRSYARGERVYVAMLSRGYEGVFHLAAPPAFRRVDAFFLGALSIALAAIRVGAQL